MRHEPAPAEKKLWWCLRAHRLNGFQFRRQHAVCGYVVDFYCPAARLVVELDGESHEGREEYDERRTRALCEDGLRVIRFVNTDVFENLDSVLEMILAECEAGAVVNRKNPPPRPSPLSTGERG
jgi:very-short-patch-repair endonuclease